MKGKLIFLILQVIILSCSCINRDTIIEKSKLLGNDYRLFQETPAWELAKAVQDGNEERINEILSKNPELINFQESKFGSTLLMLTIRNQQFKPFEFLLKNKADITIHNTYDGSTALIESCEYKFYNIKFIELILKYGANVNDCQTDIDNQGLYKSALMMAASNGNLDFVKLLLEYGANINFQNEYGQSALSESVLVNKYKISIFLLEHGANFKKPIFFRPDYTIPSEKRDTNDKGKPIYLVDMLREDFFELDSNEYKYKMQIVDFLKSKGIDYHSIPIPDSIKKKAKEKYPNSWEEYLEKY